MKTTVLAALPLSLLVGLTGCDRADDDLETPAATASAGAESTAGWTEQDDWSPGEPEGRTRATTRATTRGGETGAERYGMQLSDADFARYDLDQDGRVSTDEWADVDIRYTWDRDRDGMINDVELSTALYTAWDVDGNDRIDLVEFRDGSELWLSERAEISLGTWDTDADGTLDHDELEAGLRAVDYWDAWDVDSDDRVTDNELDTGVYQAWDLDGDGFIEAEEWQFD